SCLTNLTFSSVVNSRCAVDGAMRSADAASETRTSRRSRNRSRRRRTFVAELSGYLAGRPVIPATEVILLYYSTFHITELRRRGHRDDLATGLTFGQRAKRRVSSYDVAAGGQVTPAEKLNAALRDRGWSDRELAWVLNVRVVTAQI